MKQISCSTMRKIQWREKKHQLKTFKSSQTSKLCCTYTKNRSRLLYTFDVYVLDIKTRRCKIYVHSMSFYLNSQTIPTKIDSTLSNKANETHTHTKKKITKTKKHQNGIVSADLKIGIMLFSSWLLVHLFIAFRNEKKKRIFLSLSFGI